MKTDLTNELINELSSDAPNILKIKILCRETPGLIASAGLRSRVWTLLLLGSSSSILTDNNKDINLPEADCEEQQVLDADVHRTRSEIEDFRTVSFRSCLKNILQLFCINHNVQYKQGMNEVLAPFLYIHPPTKGSIFPYSLFEAFLFRYLQRFMCMDDSAFLFKAFRLFHILLLYFDPQLALHLHEQDFLPELYSPQWFLTLYARSLPLPHVVRLWDMMIAIDDPSFTFFIGLCLLRKKRDELILSGCDTIPEIIVKLQFSGEEEIDQIVTEARDLYRVTPRCFLRFLRLCCVSTTELMPQPKFSGKWSRAGYSLSVHEFDKVLSVQAARSCLMMSAQELVDSLAPMLSGTALSDSSSASDKYPPQQYVIIDLRTFEEINASGGGSIPKAMQLEPGFLQRPEQLAIWLQHFDGMTGCNICIVDMPPVRWTGFALWRRLLLGEGDESSGTVTANEGQHCDDADDMRVASGSSHGESDGRKVKAPNPSVSSSKERSSPLVSAAAKQQIRDEQSKHAKAEKAALEDDASRPAMQLAQAFQANSFPKVSVLEGGFPVLVEQLMTSRGTVEPVIINHDPSKWAEFLRNTGREIKNSNNGNHTGSKNRVNKNTASKVSTDAGDRSEPQTVDDLTQLQVYQYAKAMAERLHHPYMLEVLKLRIRALQPEIDSSSEAESNENFESTAENVQPISSS